MPKAVRFHQLGGPEVLQIEEVDLREPGPGEVAMRVKAAGLNRAECLYFRGEYNEKPTLPSGLGYDVVGTVTAVGSEVGHDLIGREFATIPGYSQNVYPSQAEEAIVPASALAALPESLSAAEGASVWMPYGTAFGALVEFGKLGPDDFVIITAASSSVGLAAIQIARAQGAIAIATTRTSAKRQQLLDLGAHHVIATAEEDLPATVAEITGGKGARVVFDPVGGDYINTLAQATADEGTIFLYGRLSGKPTPYPMTGYARGVAVAGYMLRLMKTPERLERLKRYIYDRLVDGTFRPKVDRTFPFRDVRAAYTYLEGNTQVGKVVITF
jgi:NADPH2:quinone reductase